MATAIVITILNPNFDSYLGVSSVNSLATVLSTVALNYTHGQGLSTMYIVPQVACNCFYFALPSGVSANIIFDVVGYFAVSQQTPLECDTVTTQGTGIGNVANNSQFSFGAAPACLGPNNSPVSVSCNYGGASLAGLALTQVGPAVAGTGFNACVWRNQTGIALDGNSFYVVTSCCHLPGRN